MFYSGWILFYFILHANQISLYLYRANTAILLYSVISFCSILLLFHPILFYSIPIRFHSVLFIYLFYDSILVLILSSTRLLRSIIYTCTVTIQLFCFILFYSTILFYPTVLFFLSRYILLCSSLCYSILFILLFHSIRLLCHSTVFHSTLFYIVYWITVL